MSIDEIPEATITLTRSTLVKELEIVVERRIHAFKRSARKQLSKGLLGLLIPANVYYLIRILN